MIQLNVVIGSKIIKRNSGKNDINFNERRQ